MGNRPPQYFTPFYLYIKIFNMKKLLYCFIFFAQTAEIFGQNVPVETPTKPIHSLSLGVGFSRTALKFETVSPFVFT